MKSDRMILVCFQDKPFNITVIQVYVPGSIVKEAEVEWFYENLQDLLARVCASCFSCVWLSAILWTVVRQAPLFVGFLRQEYWNGLPDPPLGDLPSPGIKLISLRSPTLAGRFLTTSAIWEAPQDLLELTHKKQCPFHHGEWNAKVRSQQITWSNRQLWPWSTKRSRAKANSVLSRECTGHSKHPLSTTQEVSPHIDITRWSSPKSDWLYSLQANLENVKSPSRVRLFASPWTVAHQAPPSVEFSRQEYWSGLLFPSPWDLPDSGIEPGSPTLQSDALLSESPGRKLGEALYYQWKQDPELTVAQIMNSLLENSDWNCRN